MKTLKAQIQNNQLTQLSVCESTLTLLASRCCLAWQFLLTHVRRFITSLKDIARLNHQTGRDVKAILSQANLLTNRHWVGIALLVVGIVSLFAHLFFNPFSVDHQVCGVLGFSESQCWNGKEGELSKGWCYTSWFDYIGQIRFYLALLFWSVALVLLVPPKYTISFAVSVVLHAVGWSWIIHYSFFSTSHKTINSLPAWQIWVMMLAIAVAFFKTIQPLAYWEHHKKRGNWQRFVGVTELDLPADAKEPMYKQLAKEYREIQKMI